METWAAGWEDETRCDQAHVTEAWASRVHCGGRLPSDSAVEIFHFDGPFGIAFQRAVIPEFDPNPLLLL
jgi:hypothetical protein